MKSLYYWIFALLIGIGSPLALASETHAPPTANSDAEFIYKCFTIQVEPFEDKETLKTAVLKMVNTHRNKCVGYNAAEHKFLFQVTCMTPCKRNLDQEEDDLRTDAKNTLRELNVKIEKIAPVEYYELRNLLYNQR